MNSFETDLKRAIFSRGFGIGLAVEILILMTTGFSSDLFKMCLPVLCTLPYGTAWLADYETGFVKACLPRVGRKSYIAGKLLACGLSGGFLEVLGCQIFLMIKNDDSLNIDLILIFMSGMLWALVAAALAALSKSYYISYGGSFVIYYFMVILHERYFKSIYCLYPYEWVMPEHSWVFDRTGILLLVGGLCLLIGIVYFEILRRCLDNV